MSQKSKKRFFRQSRESAKPTNAETINSLVFNNESISTLSNINITTKDLIYRNFKSFLSIVNKAFEQDKIRFILKSSSLSIAFSLLLAVFVFKVPIIKLNQANPEKYAIFASKPLKLESLSLSFNQLDSRAEKINNVFEYFNCPIAGTGETYVQKADEYDIPYWVVASIAFQESSCGKNVPYVDGKSSNNYWGWAVYGGNVHTFNTPEDGIDVVSRYMSNRFYSRNITDLCEIMKVYTPPSKGSWCAGVGYFRDFILNFKTPEVY